MDGYQPVHKSANELERVDGSYVRESGVDWHRDNFSTRVECRADRGFRCCVGVTCVVSVLCGVAFQDDGLQFLQHLQQPRLSVHADEPQVRRNRCSVAVAAGRVIS